VSIGVRVRPYRYLQACALAGALLAAGMLHHGARAAEHVVHLVTESEHGRFLFEPPVLFAQPGDTVRFVPDDAMHAVKSIAGMLPAGAASWRGRMGEEIVVVLEQPGVYGVKCRSGYDVGMVGMLVVGDDPPNFREAQRVRHPPAASMAFREMFAVVGCRLQLSACPD
jgi:pseudoazurin